MTERTSKSPALRVALLVDALTQPAWVRAAIERMMRDGHAHIVAVAINRAPPMPAAGGAESRLGRWVKNRGTLLYAAYRRFDRWRFPVPDSPFALVDIADLVADARIVDVVPRQTAFSDYFPDEAVAALRECDLDVAVRLGFRIVRGSALSIARHGMWSYHHGDHETKRGGPPAFWEVVEGEATTGAMLQVLSEDLDGGHVLMRGWVRTDRQSVARNAAQLYRMAEPFLARSLQRLALGGRRAIGLDSGSPEELSAYSNRLYRHPQGADVAGSLARIAFSSEKGAARGTWELAYRRVARPEQWHRLPALAPFQFTRLTPPVGRHWRYPVPARDASGDWVIFADAPIAAPREGAISGCTFDASGKPTEARTLIGAEQAVTHPSHAMHDGRHLLVVEAPTRQAVEAWTADAVGGPWRREATLLEGNPWRRPVLMAHGQRWLLLVSVDVEARGGWEELHLFFAESPLGPWRAHVQNPVVVDVRNARPAGQPFLAGDRLIRPAEDATEGEGTAIRLHEITRLTETDFGERPISEIHPRWARDVVGVATLNHIPGLTVIDVRRQGE